MHAPHPRERMARDRFGFDPSGSVAIMSAVFLTIAMSCLALGVDLASLFVERRQAQGAVDLAAMAAAADLDHAEAAAKASLAANGLANASSVVVELGSYTPDPAINYKARFTAGTQPTNAVRVTLTKSGTIYFARAFTKAPVKLGVSATASSATQAAYSVGSRLLAVRGGIINGVLGGLLDSNVTLSVMDYNALVSGNVSLVPFLNALATRLDIKAGTYNDVLASSATMGDIIAAMAATTRDSGQTSASLALDSLASQLGGQVTVPLSALFNLGPIGQFKLGDPVAGLSATFVAMDIVSAAAVLANGKHQVTIDLAVNVPGLLALRLDIAIGEPMQHSSWASVGQPGSLVQTAQTRLRLTAKVAGSGSLLGTSINVPLYLDLAYARGRLARATCSSAGQGTVTVGVTPGIAEVWLGDTATDMTNFSSPMSVVPATLVSLPLAKVTGSAHVELGNLTETPLVFSPNEIGNGTIKRTDTSDYMESLVTSTLENLNLKVEVLGLGLGVPGGLTSTVAAILQPVAAPLDDILYSILTTLGVHLGEADVQVQGIYCRGGGQLAG